MKNKTKQKKCKKSDLWIFIYYMKKENTDYCFIFNII